MEIKVNLTADDYSAIAEAVAKRMTLHPSPGNAPAHHEAVAPIMVSKKQATHLLGIPELMLAQGVKEGRVTEVVMSGSRGAQYLVEELRSFAKWVFQQKTAGRLSPAYLRTLAQTSESDHEQVHPTTAAQRREKHPPNLPAPKSAAQPKRAARGH